MFFLCITWPAPEMGAVLTVRGRVVAWFETGIGKEDESVFGHLREHCEGQQTWVALVVRIASRTWQEHWLSTRTTVRDCSDRLSARTLVLKLKAIEKTRASRAGARTG